LGVFFFAWRRMMSKKPNGYWTEERIREEALKYQTRSAFCKGSGTAYAYAIKEGVLDVVCAHMPVRKKDWDLEKCKLDAMRFTTRKDWQTQSSGAYDKACSNGWLDQCCEHMPVLRKALDSWTTEEIKKSTVGFATREAWRLHDGRFYQAAKAKGILDEVFPVTGTPPKYWTKARCLASAARHTTRTEWYREAIGAVEKAKLKGWFEECCAHMEEKNKPAGYWTKAACLASAKKYKTVSDWVGEEASGYVKARRQGWLEECCAHMDDRRPSDMDTIYVWEAVGESYNNKRVYKIGITSQRLGLDSRMKMCAKHNNMEPRLLVARFLGKWYVPELEKYLLTFGEDPKLDVPDGKTEFRALTDEEASTIIRIIESHPIL
jgi:hypothetical protein